jgi:hypothetical protein
VWQDVKRLRQPAGAGFSGSSIVSGFWKNEAGRPLETSPAVLTPSLRVAVTYQACMGWVIVFSCLVLERW